MLKAILRETSTPGDAVQAIQEFVADSHSLQMPKSVVSTGSTSCRTSPTAVAAERDRITLHSTGRSA